MCNVAYDGLTAIVDLSFLGHTSYVAEMDEKSWLAVVPVISEGLPIMLGTSTIDRRNRWCGEAHGAVPAV